VFGRQPERVGGVFRADADHDAERAARSILEPHPPDALHRRDAFPSEGLDHRDERLVVLDLAMGSSKTTRVPGNPCRSAAMSW